MTQTQLNLLLANRQINDWAWCNQWCHMGLEKIMLDKTTSIYCSNPQKFWNSSMHVCHDNFKTERKRYNLIRAIQKMDEQKNTVLNLRFKILSYYKWHSAEKTGTVKQCHLACFRIKSQDSSPLINPALSWIAFLIATYISRIFLSGTESPLSVTVAITTSSGRYFEEHCMQTALHWSV